MGDTGSMFLGFVLAATAMQTNQKASTAVAILIPCIALGLPIMDTLLAIGRRAIRGRPLFQADREHIHHKLMARGLIHRQAVLVLYGFCVLLGAVALVLTYANSGQSALLLVVLAVGRVRLPAVARVRPVRPDAGVGGRSESGTARSRAALQPLGRRLRQLRDARRDLAPGRRGAEGAGRGHRDLHVESPDRRGRRHARSTFTHGYGRAVRALVPVPFLIPGSKDDGPVLVLGWDDGRTEIDRDTEIAAEIFCEHLGEALDSLRATAPMRRSSTRAVPS